MPQRAGAIVWWKSTCLTCKKPWVQTPVLFKQTINAPDWNGALESLWIIRGLEQVAPQLLFTCLCKRLWVFCLFVCFSSGIFSWLHRVFQSCGIISLMLEEAVCLLQPPQFPSALVECDLNRIYPCLLLHTCSLETQNSFCHSWWLSYRSVPFPA